MGGFRLPFFLGLGKMKRNLVFIVSATFLALGSIFLNEKVMILGIVILGAGLALSYIERSLIKRLTRRLQEPNQLHKLLFDWDQYQLKRRQYLFRYFCLIAIGILLVNEATDMFGGWLILLGYLCIIEIPLDYVHRKTQRRRIKRKLITRTAVIRNQAMQ